MNLDVTAFVVMTRFFFNAQNYYIKTVPFLDFIRWLPWQYWLRGVLGEKFETKSNSKIMVFEFFCRRG